MTSDSPLNYQQQELGNIIPLESQSLQNQNQAAIGQKYTRKGLKNIWPKWRDYSWIGKRYHICKHCGAETKSPTFKGLPYPAEDERQWHHYTTCDTCNNFKCRYGFHLTYEDREMLDAKPWCAICGTQKDLHVDHCHTTNKVRGYLCSNHNKGVGLFQEDITFFHMAIDYLTSPDETTN